MASESAAIPFEKRMMGFVGSDYGQRLIVVAFSLVSTGVLLLFPGGVLAYLFGLPMIFFVPGFALVRLFFWRGTTLEAKFVLSLGLSILAVILLGLILVLTPIGLRSESTIASLVVFTLSAVGFETLWLHAGRGTDKPMDAEDGLDTVSPEVSLGKDEPRKVDKVVAAMVVAALVVSAISFGLIITAHYPSRTYFAMTNESGSADINTTVLWRTNLTLLLQVKNGEDGTRNFTIQFHEQNGTHFPNMTFESSLDKGKLWNQTFTLFLSAPGVHRLDFDLYIAEPMKSPTLYGSLHLWINVNIF